MTTDDTRNGDGAHDDRTPVLPPRAFLADALGSLGAALGVTVRICDDTREVVATGRGSPRFLRELADELDEVGAIAQGAARAARRAADEEEKEQGK